MTDPVLHFRIVVSQQEIIAKKFYNFDWRLDYIAKSFVDANCIQFNKN